jgi:hypothetical protein
MLGTCYASIYDTSRPSTHPPRGSKVQSLHPHLRGSLKGHPHRPSSTLKCIISPRLSHIGCIKLVIQLLKILLLTAVLVYLQILLTFYYKDF